MSLVAPFASSREGARFGNAPLFKRHPSLLLSFAATWWGFRCARDGSVNPPPRLFSPFCFFDEDVEMILKANPPRACSATYHDPGESKRRGMERGEEREGVRDSPSMPRVYLGF